jgi:F-type H+-transporting ATPase subunit b
MSRISLRLSFFVFSLFLQVLPLNNLWASEGGSRIGGEVFWQIVSFVLLAILLAYVMKKPVRFFLIKRREDIKNSLEQSAKKEEESRKNSEDWEKKIISLSQEIADLHQKISQEGEAECQRIIEKAVEEGDRIRKQAQVIAEQEVKKARSALRKEMVDLSVELAERLLKECTQPQDQERLVREYVGKMRNSGD